MKLLKQFFVQNLYSKTELLFKIELLKARKFKPFNGYSLSVLSFRTHNYFHLRDIFRTRSTKRF